MGYDFQGGSSSFLYSGPMGLLYIYPLIYHRHHQAFMTVNLPVSRGSVMGYKGHCNRSWILGSIVFFGRAPYKHTHQPQPYRILKRGVCRVDPQCSSLFPMVPLRSLTNPTVPSYPLPFVPPSLRKPKKHRIMIKILQKTSEKSVYVRLAWNEHLPAQKKIAPSA